MAKKRSVERPVKRSEYTLVFASRQAEVGWRDLRAAQLTAVVDAWDFLTRTPHERSPRNHPLRGDLATIVRDGVAHERWQHELAHGARIWFYVEGRTVHLVDCHTRHPNETK